MSAHVKLVALLAAVTSLGPFAMQSLAPALPLIATDLEIAPEVAQLMLSLSLVAMAFGTLILGPLSDRFGRRPVLLTALTVAAVASVAVAAAPGAETAIGARFVQAGAASAGMVLGRAVARDLHGQEAAARIIAQMTAVMVVVPMLAPALGGIVSAWTGWRGIFVLTAGFAAALFLWTRTGLTESLRERAPRFDVAEVLRSFRGAAERRAFWASCLVAALSMAAFMTFVGAAPYVAAEAHGAGPDVYGFWFAGVAGTYIVSNAAYARLSGRFGGDRLMRIGLAFATLAVLAMAGAMAAGWSGIETVFVPAILHSLGAGLVMPNAMAGAVSAYPERAGAASSLLGFVQFLAGAAAAQSGAALAHDSAMPMSLLMAGLTALSLALSIGLSHVKRSVTV